MVDERPRATDEEMAAWEANAHKLLHEKAPKQYGPQMAILILLAEVRASRELLAKLEKAVGGFRWLGNNLHNVRDSPAEFKKLYKAALVDADACLPELARLLGRQG